MTFKVGDLVCWNNRHNGLVVDLDDVGDPIIFFFTGSMSRPVPVESSYVHLLSRKNKKS